MLSMLKVNVLSLIILNMCYIVIYMFMQHHNDTIIKTHEDFFNNIFTSHFITRVRKGCSRFACERVLETELHILTPTVMTVTLCLSCSPDVGVHSIGAFRGPPRSGVASLPHLVSSCLEFCWQLLGPPELN